MTPTDKHIAALEAELERHIIAGNIGVSAEAVRRAIALLPNRYSHAAAEGRSPRGGMAASTTQAPEADQGVLSARPQPSPMHAKALRAAGPRRQGGL